MPEFFVGDAVKVEMPRGYSNRGVLGVSLLYTTSPEARFDGATGTVTDINPVGPYSVHQYLVDFRTHDNSRAGLPWQAQWFREEWLGLVERAAVGTAVGTGSSTVASPMAAQAGGGGVATAVRSARATDGAGATDRAESTDGAAETDIDPAAASAGGFSTGEDSELANQDRPASAPPSGRTTQTPEGGGYFGTPAVAKPMRDHGGEERGDGKVGPAAAGEPAAGANRQDAATAELPRQGDDTARLDEAALSADAGASGRSTGSISGAAATAPSSAIGETDLRTTPTGGGEAAADTAERYAAAQDPSGDHDPVEESHEAQPFSRSGTSLLDPSRVTGFDEEVEGT